MSISLKNQAFYLKTLLFLALSNFIAVNPVEAFSITFDNSGFEGTGSGGFTSWNTTGDTSVQSTFQTISPTAGSYQALITNSCPATAETLCQGSTSSDGRNDDDPRSVGAFNYSGNDQISADVKNPALQNFFGLSANDFSIAREGGSLSGFRTAKEGSGIYQDITIEISQSDVDSGMNAFQLSFNYAYLTNDGQSTLFGDQDFAFFTLGLYDSGTDTYTPTLNSGDAIEVLADSGDTLSSPTSDSFIYQDTNSYVPGNEYNYSITGLDAGTYTYRLGYGVVDVDNTGRSSALLLDNLQISQDVPFEFSPGLGLGIVFTLILADRVRRKTISLTCKNTQ
ncbi:MAG: hypothetical protein QNJ70_31290 [Xenococcaceae cyanobacterium MO_207.B15]|nr:hypothetical protein [Xenococcaceae cyanobacterium MO_207.B15]